MKILQPTYELTLPSTGKVVKYRPFTVKEEKSLLLSIQEDNPSLTISIVKSLVNACTFEQVDPEKIAYFDLEYIFLMIRAKAVGENLELIGKCECSPEARTEFIVSLEDATIEGLDQKSLIEIPDLGIHVMMKHPNIDNLTKTITDESTDSDIFDEVARMIDYIATEDDVQDNMTHEEKVEWVSSLTPKQQRPIAKYINQMPRLVLRAGYNCHMCGKEHKVNVAGLDNFFV